jgi:hypothetical protein
MEKKMKLQTSRILILCITAFGGSLNALAAVLIYNTSISLFFINAAFAILNFTIFISWWGQKEDLERLDSYLEKNRIKK